jgi:hypothetical protein
MDRFRIIGSSKQALTFDDVSLPDLTPSSTSATSSSDMAGLTDGVPG